MSTKKMNRKDFDELVKCCRNYDPYVQYIDNYKLFEQTQESNAHYSKWATEILINYIDGYKCGVIYECSNQGDNTEKKLIEWLADNGVEVEAPAKRIWTEDEIKVLIQTNDEVLYNALKKLYACQTEDEKQTETTREHNGVGFNAYDAKFLTSVSEFLVKTGFLTSKQKMYVRKKLVKYNKQLTKLANA